MSTLEGIARQYAKTPDTDRQRVWAALQAAGMADITREISTKLGRPTAITVETAQGTVTYGEHG